MRKIKIAQVINSLKPGGGERFLVDLLQVLPRDEFQVTVFCLYSKGELAHELEHIGISVNVLNIPRKIGLQGYVRLYNALKMVAFDIELISKPWVGSILDLEEPDPGGRRWSFGS